MIKSFVIRLCILLISTSACSQKLDSPKKTKHSTKMEITKQKYSKPMRNSNKSVLARGCDPVLSLEFSKVVPQYIGNAAYVPTSNDADFFEKLTSEKWSVIYFAPGACRFDAAKRPIPGGNASTTNWSLEQYRELIYKLQGENIQIVESLDENEAIELLNKALDKAREVK